MFISWRMLLRVRRCHIKTWDHDMKIVPALLAEKQEIFLARLRQAETFSDYIQIDLMDGIFVPSKSFPVEDLKDAGCKVPFEVHLMLNNPWSFLEFSDLPNLKQVIFHFESKITDHIDFIHALRQKSLKAGLAIKPETELEKFQKTAEYVDTILFLTVDPGRYGSIFKPEVLKKIDRTRTLFPGKSIAVDGGVSLDNLNEFLKLGVDYVCVGSRIFMKGDPRENFRQFVKKVDEIERKSAR
jgi:ribulose-phosphate 3-epimerase